MIELFKTWLAPLMPWLKPLLGGAGIAAVAASIYGLGYEAGHNAGYRKGDEAGYVRGSEAAHKLNDTNTRLLLAQSRAEAEARLRAEQEANREIERRHEEALEAARVEADRGLAAATARRDRELVRLRALQQQDAGARDPVRAADRGAGVPEAVDPGPSITVPRGLLLAAVERGLGRAHDSETLNLRWYGMCRRVLISWRTGKVEVP